jgi:hypothetical protein
MNDVLPNRCDDRASAAVGVLRQLLKDELKLLVNVHPLHVCKVRGKNMREYAQICWRADCLDFRMLYLDSVIRGVEIRILAMSCSWHVMLCRDRKRVRAKIERLGDDLGLLVGIGEY